MSFDFLSSSSPPTATSLIPALSQYALLDHFGKKPSDIKVVVAMSGGVDSSVAAALMHELGYQVIGITLQLYDHGEAISRQNSCCAGQDIKDARAVAASLGIAHYVLDYESQFQTHVIADFADSYVRGETPLPCVRCNQSVKFKDLLQETLRLQADALVTGHYVEKVLKNNHYQMQIAHDDRKDQSYFLFATLPSQLDYLHFPLGGQSKEETRLLAEKFHLPVASKPDSQDICFVPKGDYRAVLQKLRPTAFRSGDIVDLAGNVLQKHEGIINYTVGQRRGLKIGGRSDHTEPLYVLKIDAKANQIIVGPRHALGVKIIYIENCNWLFSDIDLFDKEISVKVRSTMLPVSARLVRNHEAEASGDNRVAIIFAENQEGISPGQAAVCYSGQVVLGGGWIVASHS